MKRNRFLAILLIIAFAPAVCAQEFQAKWVDQSDELPGMASDGEITALLVGLGVLVTAGIVVLVVKKKQNKKLETSSIGDSQAPNLGLSTTNYQMKLIDDLNKASELSPLQVITGIDQIPNQNLGSNVAVSVGLRFTF